MCRIAHTYQRSTDDVESWSEQAFIAAVVTLTADDERCPSCGVAEAEQWHVTATTQVCWSCMDRDITMRDLAKQTDEGAPAGVRVRWEVTDRNSSARARYDPEVAAARYAEQQANILAGLESGS